MVYALSCGEVCIACYPFKRGQFCGTECIIFCAIIIISDFSNLFLFPKVTFPHVFFEISLDNNVGMM